MGVLTVATLQRVQDKREIEIRNFKYTSTENQTNVTTWSHHSTTVNWSHLRHTRHKFKVVLPIRQNATTLEMLADPSQAYASFPWPIRTRSCKATSHSGNRSHCVFQQPPWNLWPTPYGYCWSLWAWRFSTSSVEVFLQEGFSTSEISAIESRIKEARAVTEIGWTRPPPVSDPMV